jgi:cytochrome oxidase assembly protein ShyY1
MKLKNNFLQYQIIFFSIAIYEVLNMNIKIFTFFN